MDVNEVPFEPCHREVPTGACTYLAPKLIISPKGTKGDST
jgi:hypothetical protein